MIRTSLIATIVASLLPLSFSAFAAAQSATPVPVTCTTTPRTNAELASLGATPTAAPSATPAAGLPSGTNVDADTFKAIQRVLDQLSACGTAGEVNAVLALYTDAYVTNVALAPEAVPIVQGTPAAAVVTPAPATPIAAKAIPLALVAARQASDGSINALVMFGANPQLFVFVNQAGAWRIDRANPFTPASGSAANLPAPVQLAVTAAAAKLGVPEASLTVVFVDPREWSDGSLGCPEPGRAYAQVITEGWLAVFSGVGQSVEYHTDSVQHLVACRTFAD